MLFVPELRAERLDISSLAFECARPNGGGMADVLSFLCSLCIRDAKGVICGDGVGASTIRSCANPRGRLVIVFDGVPSGVGKTVGLGVVARELGFVSSTSGGRISGVPPLSLSLSTIVRAARPRTVVTVDGTGRIDSALYRTFSLSSSDRLLSSFCVLKPPSKGP